MSIEEGRVLRNPTLRNALYDSTDGRCALCGSELETGWHADHITPWAEVQRTNIFEMQPLCPSCNAAKGTKNMMNNFGDSIDPRQLRPGQRGAIDEIFMRVRAGQKNIAIVLPPGYGKSDVIRVSAVMLMLQNMVCRTLILEPAENLRGQIVDQLKMNESVKRYRLPPVLGNGIRTYEAKTAPVKPWPPGRNRDAPFVSMTIQMANRHRLFLEQWVANESRESRAPVLVFVDEAHTGSDENEWGGTTRALRDAGAVVVLLTGTPYRSDKRRIEGFQWDEEEVKPVRIGRTRSGDSGERLVDIYEGTSTILKLKPDYEHTLHEAWEVDSPPSLCKLTRLPYDFDLESHDRLTGDVLPDTALSRVSPWQLGGKFGRLLREDAVVEYLCSVFVEQLASKQAQAPDAAGIIFVGNNDNSILDPLEREHALKVKEALRRLDHNLKVVVATSDNSSQGIAALKRFQGSEEGGRVVKGQGDVLVVKQMGGVGYDAPRLKVCLDLSVVRQPGPFVQRVMRIARTWRYGEGEREVQQTAIYITPKDQRGEALWQKFIADEHGETSLTNVEYIQTLQAGEQQRLGEEYELIGIRPADYYSDTKQQESPADSLPTVMRVIHAAPPIGDVMTHPDIEKVIPGLREALGVPESGSAVPTPTPHSQETVVVDGNKEQKDVQKEINKAARRVAEQRLGRRYMPGDKDFGAMARTVMYQHKRATGLANKKPENYTAQEADRLLESLLKEERGNG